jgi:prevent-host-death family protein
MRVLSTRDFRNSSADALNAVEAGETIVISRNGVEIAELRPLAKRHIFVPLNELLKAFHSRPAGEGYSKFRADQDNFFEDDGDRI